MKQQHLQQELSAILDQLQAVQTKLEESQTVPTSFTEYDLNAVTRLANQIRYHHHPVRDAENALKSRYCTLLATILAHMQGDLMTNLVLFSRLHQAIAPEEAIVAHLQLASNLDEYIFDEFLPLMADTAYRYTFIVDALILSSCNGQPTAQSLQYIAEIANLFAFSQSELEQLTLLAKIILLQDRELFAHAFSNLNPLLDYFTYYTQSFVSGVLVANERCFKFIATEFVRFPVEDYHQITSAHVDISHAYFDLTQFTVPIRFHDNQTVTLRNCAFNTKKGAYLPQYFSFEHIHTLEWHNLMIDGLFITTPHPALSLFQLKDVHFFKVDGLTITHSQFTIDLGELKAQNALIQAPELMAFKGALIHAEAITIAKLYHVQIRDTHTRLQFAVQNVLFGGTEFKERTVTDSEAHSLISGLEHAEQQQIASNNSSLLFS